MGEPSQRSFVHWLGGLDCFGSRNLNRFGQALLEPLKQIRVPSYPGEEALVIDGAIIGFEVVLGSTRFSYQWHTIAPAGWEPLKDWLHDAVHRLLQLTDTPYGY